MGLTGLKPLIRRSPQRRPARSLVGLLGTREPWRVSQRPDPLELLGRGCDDRGGRTIVATRGRTVGLPPGRALEEGSPPGVATPERRECTLFALTPRDRRHDSRLSHQARRKWSQYQFFISHIETSVANGRTALQAIRELDDLCGSRTLPQLHRELQPKGRRKKRSPPAKTNTCSCRKHHRRRSIDSGVLPSWGRRHDGGLTLILSLYKTRQPCQLTSPLHSS